jgi:hypothetical protein
METVENITEVATEVAPEITPETAAFLGGLLATFGIAIVLIGAVWYILQVVAYWKIFTKAGKPGWHSIIPVLSTWDEIDLSWNRTMAWVFVALTVVTSLLSKSLPQNGEESTGLTFLGIIALVCGIAVIVLALIAQYKLAKAFGKGFGFFIGLLLLNPIFKLILGFGGAKYQGRQG